MAPPRKTTQTIFDPMHMQLHIIPAQPGYQAVELLFDCDNPEKDGNDYVCTGIELWPVIAWKIVAIGDYRDSDKDDWKGEKAMLCEDVRVDLEPIIASTDTKCYAIIDPAGHIVAPGVAEYHALDQLKNAVIGKRDVEL